MISTYRQSDSIAVDPSRSAGMWLPDNYQLHILNLIRIGLNNALLDDIKEGKRTPSGFLVLPPGAKDEPSGIPPRDTGVVILPPQGLNDLHGLLLKPIAQVRNDTIHLGADGEFYIKNRRKYMVISNVDLISHIERAVFGGDGPYTQLLRYMDNSGNPHDRYRFKIIQAAIKVCLILRHFYQHSESVDELLTDITTRIDQGVTFAHSNNWEVDSFTMDAICNDVAAQWVHDWILFSSSPHNCFLAYKKE